MSLCAFVLGGWGASMPGARSGSTERCFQEIAVFRCEVLSLAEHYHLPIKFTPWGFALSRGA